MAEFSGTVYLGRGPDASAIEWFASVSASQINKANGDTGTFVNGIEKPEKGGVIWRLGAGPHRVAGQLLYLGLKATSAAATVSANETVHLQERVRAADGSLRDVIHGNGDRYTTVGDGGLANNAATVVGQIVPTKAFRALKPGEEGKLYGFAQYVTADI